MAESDRIKKMAAAMLPRLQAWRRDFHQQPELSGQEKRTSAKVAEILRGLGLRVQTGVGGLGVVGLLPGGQPGLTVALRADMDALPVGEINRAPYCSRRPGVMHACGHDAHMTMALGAAALLRRLAPAGAVKFVFQPAEETVTGAAAMIGEGVMRNPKVDAIFALHLKPDLEFGAVSLRDGASMAAGIHFTIRIAGRGGHGALPDKAIDPLPPAHQIYAALQTIRRSLPPADPCVLSICAFNGGQVANIIPASVELRGTLRTYAAAVQRQAMREIRAVVRNIAPAFHTRGTVAFSTGTPAVNNAAGPAALLRRAAAGLRMPVHTVERMMGSEDFAFFQRQAPGVLAWLGTRRGRRGCNLHAPDFDFDEQILPQGAALLAACALDFLRGGGK